MQNPHQKNTLRYLNSIITIALTLLLAGCEVLTIEILNRIELTEFKVKGDQLSISGEINSQTLKQFEEIYQQNPTITTIVELNIPGSIDDETMIKLGYRIRQLGLNTHLTAKSEIYSGGVDLFLAGVKRTMEKGAKIGVHSWSDGEKEAKDYDKKAPEHEMNRTYIEKMLGDDKFYWFTIYAAPADNIHLMTEEEINKYGLITE